MPEVIDICSLDYLIGTLATAYKGLITSLIIKDFCMTGSEGRVLLKGTLLAMPEGSYQAFLLQEGIELARAEIREGFFELLAEGRQIKSNKNLQIDIVQNGRHLGTFLLRQEKTGGVYSSAFELSEDLKGINFPLLTSYLKEKPGLLKKAEDIISMVLSTKKDWGVFSEKINSFAKDLFWSDRAAFFQWYKVLADYSLRAAEALSEGPSEKPVSNFMVLLELPFENASDDAGLRSLVDVWLQSLRGSNIQFLSGFPQARKLLASIHSRFPKADIEGALRPLLHSLKELALRTPAVRSSTLDALRVCVSAEDLSRLQPYSEANRKGFLKIMEALEARLDERRFRDILQRINDADFSFSNDTELTDTFFAVIGRNINDETAVMLNEALFSFFPLFAALSPEAYRRGVMNIVGLIRHQLRSGLMTACASLLHNLDKAGVRVKEDVLMNREVASSIHDLGDDALMELYKTLLIKTVVPRPGIAGFSSDTWAELVLPLHLQRLTEFLNIIRIDSVRFRDVLVHLICNLSISGVFIPDDRLFQREVSAYLNSAALEYDFLLHYILLKQLPVFFNDVGASGKIRDYTTEIDSWSNDAVLYFLRKQVHVNASNYNIALVEKIMLAWLYEDPEILKDALPDEIFSRLDRPLLSRYCAALRPFFGALAIVENNVVHLERLIDIPEDLLKQELGKVDAEEEILSKILLLSRIYQETVKKYEVTARAGAILSAERNGLCGRLGQNIAGMKALCEIIVSPEKTVPRESLYFKRHIAFGIPSVIGSYHEPKFDALSDMLRTEEMTRVLIENIILSAEMKSGDLSPEDIAEWLSCLESIRGLFRIYDLDNFQTDEIITVLKTNSLRLSQIVDLLKIWQRELTGMVESLSNTFYRPFTEVLQAFTENGRQGHVFKSADVFIREIMSSLTGFVELDRLLERLVLLMTGCLESGKDELYAAKAGLPPGENDFFVLDDLSEQAAMAFSPLIGGKAKNLAYLKGHGLLVPPGVVFLADKTEVFQQYTGTDDFLRVLKKAVEKIEDRTGTRFGEAANPLFLSVRSGSYISMPGILSSILFCGMNPGTLDGFSHRTGNRWLALDSYRRFLEHFSTVVYGLDGKLFDDILLSYAERLKKDAVSEFNAEQMETLVALYLEALAERGLTVPSDVYEQLRLSVSAVFRSWFSERAVQFRKAMHVSGHWGTSVLIMQMIFGNERNSGASVFFTRNPHSMEKGIYGDTRENATGADLVGGEMVSRPLAIQQALYGQKSLEETDPLLFQMHEDIAARAEKAMKGLPQEIEATYIAGPNGERLIYVLQTKRMEIHRGFTKRFQDVCRMHSNIIGRGVGVHGGALSGLATFSSSPEDIRKLRKDSGMPVILLRAMASTNDVSLMPEVEGLITASGGVSSHAAILAQKFDLSAVVGCTDMQMGGDETNGAFAIIGDYSVKEGTVISIDGSTGLVYSGSCESVYWERGDER